MHLLYPRLQEYFDRSLHDLSGKGGREAEFDNHKIGKLQKKTFKKICLNDSDEEEENSDDSSSIEEEVVAAEDKDTAIKKIFKNQVSPNSLWSCLVPREPQERILVDSQVTVISPDAHIL